MCRIDRFAWTVHADQRLAQRGLTKEGVERAIQALHPIRRHNGGNADWRVDAGTFVVVYDHPHHADPRAVRIVSLWIKYQPNRRDGEDYPE